MKPVLVLVLVSVLGLVDSEGSGDGWFDLEHDYDEWSDTELEEEDDAEGSADLPDVFDPRDREVDNVIRLAEVNVPGREFDLIDMDYPEDYEEEYAYDASEESVLKIEDVTTNDIEIRLKPDTEEGEEVLLATSQIFIMVGSAFVSFAIFVLTFFLCRRMMVKKQEKKKSIPFIVVPDRKVVKESSIVKDYQKVPTTTQQILQNSHVDMYNGEPTNDNPSSVPLVP